tara:strand:- start:524 stop:655 length:132 start_codon:yes stop_codon:yes gene_type:complete
VSTFVCGIIYFLDKTMKNPIDIFKRILLDLLVPYKEGTNKKER